MDLDMCAQLQQSLQYQIDLKFSKGIYRVEVKPFGRGGVVVEISGSADSKKDASVNQYVIGAVQSRGYIHIETSRELRIEAPLMSIMFKNRSSTPVINSSSTVEYIRKVRTGSILYYISYLHYLWCNSLYALLKLSFHNIKHHDRLCSSCSIDIMSKFVVIEPL